MKEVWTKVKDLYNDEHVSKECAEERALVYLYETLIDKLDQPEDCDDFLKEGIINMIFKDEIMNSDVIVHTLNALRSIKDILKNWEIFEEFSYELLVKEHGEETAKRLLNI